MQPSVLLILLLLLSSAGFFLGKRRAFSLAGRAANVKHLHSRPVYFGVITALWSGLPALLIFFAWLLFEDTIIVALVSEELPPGLQNLPSDRLNLVINDIKNMVNGNIVSGEIDAAMQQAADTYTSLLSISHMALTAVVASLSILIIVLVRKKLTANTRARNHVEVIIKLVLIGSSTIAIFTTIGIVLSVLYESIQFFSQVSPADFLFGLEWSPQIAIRADQVGSSGAFGAIPVFLGTILISLIAMAVAVPIGLFSAIYLAEYSARRFRAVVKPLMEILAGIPTVVYGFFAALSVAPFMRNFGTVIGLDISSESALVAGVVMGIMIIPFVSSIADDVITAVPRDLRDGAYGLGATKSECIKQIVIPAALPGIVGGVLLAISRAIGETMIVVMAAGLAANLTANPFQAVTTVTVQIVTLLIGDQEFDSPKTLAAFALGLVLFMVTLVLNIIALYVVRKYREQYE
jgi:phosphate transport system permease protein